MRERENSPVCFEAVAVAAVNIRAMMPQNGEVEMDAVDESVRYFNYLRTLADLTAIASILAVQVIWKIMFDLVAVDASRVKLTPEREY